MDENRTMPTSRLASPGPETSGIKRSTGRQFHRNDETIKLRLQYIKCRLKLIPVTELLTERLSQGVDMTKSFCFMAVALLLFGAFCSHSVALADSDTESSGLPEFQSEAAFLQDVPGVSSSIAAGMLNPAAWSIQKSGGMHFSWSDMVELEDDKKPWLLAYSSRNLGFAMRQSQFLIGDKWHEMKEYTLGAAWGDWGTATGISYTWNKSDDGAPVRNRRINVGNISRWRQFSLGSVAMFDLEKSDYLLQTDFGVRPFGPRVTLFGDAVFNKDDDFEDIATGFGVTAMPIPAISLSAKMRGHRDISDSYTWDYSVGIEIGLLPTTRVSGQMGFNNDNDHVTTTYSVESGMARRSLIHGVMKKESIYPEMKLKGPISYRRYRFFDSRRTMMNTMQQISAYAAEPLVGGVVINMSGLQANIDTMWELRDQLAGLRAAGKKVVIYFDRVSMGGLMLASVADELWIDPQGMVTTPGFCIGRSYYKNLLDKVGVGIDELRFFTYKSAAEALSRTSMSDPDRQQLQAITDDFYDVVAESVTGARGLTIEDWESLVNDRGMLLPKEALELGVVDSIGTFADARKNAQKAARRTTPDPQAVALTDVMGDRVWEPLAWGEPDRIAVLYAIGGCSMDSGIRGRLLSKKIKEAASDPHIKAIVMRADSPGGDPLPSDLVSRELKTAMKKKPVVISQGQVAGSGGYWISMHSNKILASPVTITGSIGVISAHFWDDGFGEKTGLSFDYVKRGDHADFQKGPTIPLLGITIPARPYTDMERGRAEKLIRDLYDDFVAQVAEGRSMTEAEVDKVGQGRIWSGSDGLEVGLVDQIGGFWESIRLAKEMAGIPASRSVKLIEGPSLGAFNAGMFSPSLLGVVQKTGLDQLLSIDTTDADESSQTTRHGAGTTWAMPMGESLLQLMLGGANFELLPAAERFYLEGLLRSSGNPMLMIDPLSMTGQTGTLLN
jgi:protease IV